MNDSTASREVQVDLVDRTAPRTRYELDDQGFDEVPKKYRRFYRRWKGPSDTLAPNEALCPVCKIVIRSPRELRVGDRLYCMACLTRVLVIEGENGGLETRTIYAPFTARSGAGRSSRAAG